MSSGSQYSILNTETKLPMPKVIDFIPPTSLAKAINNGGQEQVNFLRGAPSSPIVYVESNVR